MKQGIFAEEVFTVYGSLFAAFKNTDVNLPVREKQYRTLTLECYFKTYLLLNVYGLSGIGTHFRHTKDFCRDAFFRTVKSSRATLTYSYCFPAKYIGVVIEISQLLHSLKNIHLLQSFKWFTIMQTIWLNCFLNIFQVFATLTRKV